MQYYYVNQASQQVGPVDIEELKKAGATPQTLVWKEGMKEWLPASTVAELKHLFAPPPTPPPITAKPPVPKEAAAPPNVNNRNKILIAAGAGLLVLVVIAAIFMFRGKKPQQEEVAIGKIDSAISVPRTDTLAKKDTTATDTTNVINVDSLARAIWDTTSNTGVTAASDTGSSFLPGFGPGASQTSNAKKPKSPAPKKTNKKHGEEQVTETRDESTSPRRSEPEKVNPARYISVSGTFRKNLVFEAILEGTIRNGYSSQVRDVTIEVTFLDGSGQSLGNKRFTQNGTVPAGASISFKFKAKPPKGAKSARYEVASASLR
jgi:hypothetical protein